VGAHHPKSWPTWGTCLTGPGTWRRA
jgi:hypothetical protein